MICPHCRKPIERKKSKLTQDVVLRLSKEGYSSRDIEMLMRERGFQVSFSTVARIIRDSKTPEEGG